MMAELEVAVPTETSRLLRAIAEFGVLGATREEVAAYLVIRGLDDLMRSGAVSLQAGDGVQS